MEGVLLGDALEQLRTLEAESVYTCVTSPPYYNLRDYGAAGQIGMEEQPEEYIAKLVDVFREVRRVLRKDGTLWVNIGDSYAGSGKGRVADGTHYMGKPSKSGDYQGVSSGILHKTAAANCKRKDLIGIPWMLAFALRADSWYLRQDIIWEKPNAMPESVRDRCTKAHEYIFLLAKSARYYFDAAAIREPCGTKGNARTFRGGGAYTNGKSFRNSVRTKRESHGNRINSTGERNRRSVWSIATAQFKAAHYATFPERLVEPCILAGCPEGGVVLDPFAGSGTTGVVAKRLRRNFIGVEINPDYQKMAQDRISAAQIEYEQLIM